jgi:hypothetical protein
VLRYVERNALKAELVSRAEDWRWPSLPRWQRRDPDLRSDEVPVGDKHWLERVNKPLSAGDFPRLRHLVLRGRPYGSESWTRETATRVGLESCLRSRGRPTEGQRVKALCPPFFRAGGHGKMRDKALCPPFFGWTTPRLYVLTSPERMKIETAIVGLGRQLIAWRAAPYPMVTTRRIGKVGCPAYSPTLVRDGFMVGNQYRLKEAVVGGRFFSSQRGFPVVAPRMQSRG